MSIVGLPVMTVAATEYVWGLPLEVAAGCIGLVGALLGSLIGAEVVRRAASSQRKHEVRMAGEARVRDRASIVLTSANRLAVAASKGEVPAARLYDFQESTTSLMAEAAGVAPKLASFAESANVQVIEEAGVGSGKGAERNLGAWPGGLMWDDLWVLAMATRDGVLGWLSGSTPEPDFNATLERRRDEAIGGHRT